MKILSTNEILLKKKYRSIFFKNKTFFAKLSKVLQINRFIKKFMERVIHARMSFSEIFKHFETVSLCLTLIVLEKWLKLSALSELGRTELSSFLYVSWDFKAF